jgi:integrase
MGRIAHPWFRSVKNGWYVMYKGRMMSLGVKGQNNKAEAYRAWAVLLANGSVRAEHAQVAADEPVLVANRDEEQTVAGVIDGYLAHAAKTLHPRTVKDHRRFLLPFQTKHGPATARTVTPAFLEAYASRPTWGNTTRNLCLSSLATAFKWSGFPQDGLKLPAKESRGAEWVISAEDAKVLLEAADRHFYPLVRFMFLTGCRPSESLILTAANLDERASLVRLKKHKTSGKTGLPRLIHLTPDALVLVLEQKAANPDGPLFRNSRGKPWTLNAVVNRFWRLSKKTGIKVSGYMWRHSLACDSLARGVPEAHVAEILGHVGGAAIVARTYGHLGSRTRELKESLNKVR